MPVIFPPIENADEDGLVAIGGNLDVETLTTAYHQGIFPWPIASNYPLTWFSPDPRGILDFKDFHISKSFRRFLNNNPYHVTFNQNFIDVIKHCSKVKRVGQKSTWITQQIINGYTNLFNHHYAYSVEIWNQDLLVGGLYGVCFGELISGESMFHLEDNTSKLAIYYLIEKLATKNIEFIDTQMVTPILKNLGGKEIPRLEFINRIRKLNLYKTRAELF